MGIHLSTLPENASPALVELEKDIHIAKLTSISALSISAYDWFVCFDEEVDLVWRASHSVFKYMALFARYMGLVMPIGIVVLRLGNWTKEECEKMKIEAAITSTLVILSCDYLLALRTAAIYSFRRNITILVATLIGIQTALAIWATTGWVRIELPEGIPGCFVRPGMGHILGVSIYWIPSSVTDLVLFVLTVSKVFPIWSSSKESRLSWVLLRDEIMQHPHVFRQQSSRNDHGPVDSYALASTRVSPQARFEIVIGFCRTSLISGFNMFRFHLALNLRSVDRYPHKTAEEEPISMEELLATPPTLQSPPAPPAPSTIVPLDIENRGNHARGQMRARGVEGRTGERDVVSVDDSRFRRAERQELAAERTRNTV
ncbi:hypothetical protein JCM5350_001415 [Sporobolomyces pararoseus]